MESVAEEDEDFSEVEHLMAEKYLSMARQFYDLKEEEEKQATPLNFPAPCPPHAQQQEYQQPLENLENLLRDLGCEVASTSDNNPTHPLTRQQLSSSSPQHQQDFQSSGSFTDFEDDTDDLSTIPDEEFDDILNALEEQLGQVEDELIEILTHPSAAAREEEQHPQKTKSADHRKRRKRKPKRQTKSAELRRRVLQDFPADVVQGFTKLPPIVPEKPQRVIHRNPDFEKSIQKRQPPKPKKTQTTRERLERSERLLNAHFELQMQAREAYATALRQKVARQRKQRAEEAARKKQQEEKYRQTLREQRTQPPRLPKSQNITDTAFLNTIPKSQFYLKAIEDHENKKQKALPPPATATQRMLALTAPPPKPVTSKRKSKSTDQQQPQQSGTQTVKSKIKNTGRTNSWAITGELDSDDEENDRESVAHQPLDVPTTSKTRSKAIPNQQGLQLALPSRVSQNDQQLRTKWQTTSLTSYLGPSIAHKETGQKQLRQQSVSRQRDKANLALMLQQTRRNATLARRLLEAKKVAPSEKRGLSHLRAHEPAGVDVPQKSVQPKQPIPQEPQQRTPRKSSKSKTKPHRRKTKSNDFPKPQHARFDFNYYSDDDQEPTPPPPAAPAPLTLESLTQTNTCTIKIPTAPRTWSATRAIPSE
eukprot:m.47502 g.47502  ORF g.47502 m.47502 type:complete len:649 (-) comp17663_c0_seq1:19-1965(-)